MLSSSFGIMLTVGWHVAVFESSRGEKHVEEFFLSLNPETIAKVVQVIDLLELHGPRLNMPHARKLTSILFELRIRGRQEIRVIYAYLHAQIYLLHAFKKTNKANACKRDACRARAFFYLEIISHI